MKRRDFLKTSSLITAPILLNGVSVMATPSTGSALFDMLAGSAYGCGKILVIIQQNGGNDGLNTVVPLDKYDSLTNARNNILLPIGSLDATNLTATTALHPAMVDLKNLYTAGKLCVVQSVSYPNPSFSHFRATDIWFSGSASNQSLDTGWLGRTLDTNYPDYPAAYPNDSMKDPVAIQIGSTLPFSLQGPAINMGYNVTNPSALLDVVNATTDPAPNNDYGRELSFLRQMKNQSNVYKGVITNAYNGQSTQSNLYPAPSNSLADQLKIVARLIGGGLTTPIYIVNHPFSHDTHDNQMTTQANNLGILSKAIAAFQDDVELMGKGDKVAGMTFSEFGRRIISNASLGTDHGTSAPVFFFGASLKPGIVGNSPNMPLMPKVSDQLPMQHDFRQIYASVMVDWLCLTPEQSATVLGSDFARLPIFIPAAGAVLPLNNTSLSGQFYHGKSKLNLQVEGNLAYDQFILEFSPDGINFSEIKRLVNAKLHEKENYTLSHEVNLPKMYYRVTGITLQGKREFSNVLMLRSSEKTQLMRVYPNPIENYRINIQLFEQPASAVDVTIYDLMGSKLYYNRFTSGVNVINFTVPPNFSKQTHYILQVMYGDTVRREQVIFK